MRRSTMLSIAMIFMGMVGVGFADDEPGAKSGVQSDSQSKGKSKLTISTTGEGRSSEKTALYQKARSAKSSPDENAIRKTGETYATAFSEGDAKAAAAHFTADAEYVDAQGIIFEGRQAIEDLLTAFFSNNPGRKLQLRIESLRFLSPGVVIEDGITVVSRAKNSADTESNGAEPTVAQYTAIHVKNDGKWLTASVRERAVKSPRQHRAQLKELEWMVGEWVHEGDDAIVRFSCHPVDNGTFLVRKFAVHVAGQETMTGTQRIGWDAQSGKFRAWVFDSDGGFSEGCWHRSGDDWVLKLTGVTADGEEASNTSIYSFVDARTMTFRSVNHEVAGIGLPDSHPVTIVRQPPRAESETHVEASE